MTVFVQGSIFAVQNLRGVRDISPSLVTQLADGQLPMAIWFYLVVASANRRQFRPATKRQFGMVLASRVLFGTAVLATTIWRRPFGPEVFWRCAVLAPASADKFV